MLKNNTLKGLFSNRNIQTQFYLTSLERLKRSVQSLGRGFGAEPSEAKLDFAQN